MMTKCARCGLEADDDDLTLSGVCPGVDVLACRDRQIAAQAALLRSVTGKLEEALGAIQEGFPSQAAAAIESVLEMLS